MKILKETKNGRLFKCSSCSNYHLEFNNININFNEARLQSFQKYLQEMDGFEFEIRNSQSSFKRKIVIQTNTTGLNILLNQTELEELKCLLDFRKSKKMEFDWASYESLFVEMNLN
ncbi:MAG: hypothetical protein JXR34_10495 [Bacteroidales bacterium]|nr:hypothetical protein [Bacteroidales bacterium]